MFNEMSHLIVVWRNNGIREFFNVSFILVELDGSSKGEVIRRIGGVGSIHQLSGYFETVVGTDSVSLSLQETGEYERVLRLTFDLVSEGAGHDCVHTDLW